MKKIFKSIAVLVFFITLSGCSSSSDSINYIQPTEVFQKIENKESFVLVIGKESCSACQSYKDTVVEFQKEHPDTLVYVDLEKVKDADGKSAEELSNDLYNKLRYSATPTTYVFKDGEIKTYVEGTQTISDLNARFETYSK